MIDPLEQLPPMHPARAILITFALAAVAPASHAEPIGVVVGIAPHKYLVERVGGEHVAVTVVVGEGQSPHTFQVRPRQLSEFSRASVYFRAGLEFEEGLLRRLEDNFPAMQVVALAEAPEGAHTHHHHEDGEHDHSQCNHDGWDPHTWLHPGLLNEQAGVVTEALSALRPDLKDEFEANRARFRDDLAALHMELKEMLAPFAGRAFHVFHPAFGRFAAAYDLVQVSIEREGKAPGAQRLYDLIQSMKAEGVRTLFVQPQFSRQEAEAIAGETGATIAVLDPLAEDVMGNLRAVGEAIRAGLGGDAG